MTKITDQKRALKLHNLTQEAKEWAMKANIGFYEVARRLYEIKKDKLYKYWDESEDTTWKSYISQSEIPVSVHIANHWTRIWEKLVIENGYDPKKLCSIPYTKLYDLIPVLEQRRICAGTDKEFEEFKQEWLSKAENNSRSDLREEIDEYLSDNSKEEAEEDTSSKKELVKYLSRALDEKIVLNEKGLSEITSESKKSQIRGLVIKLKEEDVKMDHKITKWHRELDKEADYRPAILLLKNPADEFSENDIYCYLNLKDLVDIIGKFY